MTPMRIVIVGILFAAALTFAAVVFSAENDIYTGEVRTASIQCDECGARQINVWRTTSKGDGVACKLWVGSEVAVLYTMGDYAKIKAFGCTGYVHRGFVGAK